MVESQSHGFVDIFYGSNTIFAVSEAFRDQRRNGSARDEALSILAHDGLFPDLLTESERGLQGLLRGFRGNDHLDEFHDLGWEKPVRAQDFSLPCGRLGERDDAQLRRI